MNSTVTHPGICGAQPNPVKALARLALLLTVLGFAGTAARLQAQEAQFLYTTNGATWNWRTDSFGPSAGATFQVGAQDQIVTHLGYFDKDADGLLEDHPVGIYLPDPNFTNLVADVIVPSGTAAFFTNGFRWVALAKPVTLKAGSNYVLAAQSPLSAGDQWPDAYAPNWNSYFIGTTPVSSRGAAYDWPFVAWPHQPAQIPGWGAGLIYGEPNLAYFPGSVAISSDPQSATRYVSETLTLSVTAAGSGTLSYQWYKAPATLLAGQTSNTLTLASLALADAGDYYVKVQNATSSAQSANATVTVLSWVAPSFTQTPVSQTAYVNQQVTFTSVVTGSPVSSLFYQWRLGATDIPGATNATLKLVGVTAASVGTYTVTVTNTVGSASTSATLQVLTPTAGTYEASVIGIQPLIYYRFTDIDSTNALRNLGTLGTPGNGQIDGALQGVDGPLAPAYPNLEATNRAMFADGATANGVIPPLNVSSSTGNHMSMAAWVNLAGAQLPWAGLVYYRNTGGPSGMMINGDGMLSYSWGGYEWGFRSEMVLPQNQWVFIALVVQPSGATLYMNDGSGMRTTNDVYSLPSVPFSGSTMIGWDAYGNSYDRRYLGAIDEVTVFDRPLSPSEVYTLNAAVSNVPPRIVQDPQTTTRSSGNPLTLTVTTFGTPPLVFQWYKDGTGPIPAATAATYTIAAVSTADAGSYYVIVTNSFGTATSAKATVTVLEEAPVLTTLPQASTNWLSTSATLTGAAQGSLPLTYQWRKDGVDLPGQTTTTLAFPSLLASDDADYVLHVQNAFGQTNSPAVHLTVLDPLYSFQMLFSTNGYASLRNNFPNLVGATFRVGAVDRTVTHLGYFDADADGLIADHHVGIFSKAVNPGQGTLLAEVLVPTGTGAIYTNGYRWVALATPFTLQANTEYVIAASDNNTDSWPDSWVPEWNVVFVGDTPVDSRYTEWDGTWPHDPSNVGMADWGYSHAYGAYNLAQFPSEPPARLNYQVIGGKLILSWSQGTLQQASDIAGQFSDIQGAPNPYEVTPTDAKKFFRVKVK